MNGIQIAALAGLFILGMMLGSFCSVVIHRLHKEEGGIFRGRSKCPHCQTHLRPGDLIPLLSYLMLRGKCRICKGDISAMYPLLELLGGVLLALLYFKYPFVDGALNFSSDHTILFALFTYYTFVLLVTFFYDTLYLKISDQIMLPAIAVAVISSLLPGTPHIIDSLLGAMIPFIFFGAQYYVSRGKWMGSGDLRVGVFMGLILGWQLTIVALVLTYFVGSLVSIAIVMKHKKFRDVKVPFAPFIITAIWITLFFGNGLMEWYLRSLAV